MAMREKCGEKKGRNSPNSGFKREGSAELWQSAPTLERTCFAGSFYRCPIPSQAGPDERSIVNSFAK